MEDDSVVLYVVPDCPLCDKVRDLLRNQRVSYMERDISKDYSALRAMFRATRQGLVPVVYRSGRAIVRPDESELADFLG